MLEEMDEEFGIGNLVDEEFSHIKANVRCFLFCEVLFGKLVINHCEIKIHLPWLPTAVFFEALIWIKCWPLTKVFQGRHVYRFNPPR